MSTRTVAGMKFMPSICADSNIWIYALTRPRTGDGTRHERAQAAIERAGHLIITPQIINEVGFVLRRKQAWSDADLRPLIEQLCANCMLHIPSSHWHLLALDLRQTYQLSYWDSLVVAAAIEVGCDTLLSEDMQHGQIIQGIRLINPLI